MKKLLQSSTFQLIALVMAVTSLVAFNENDFGWTAWVGQLDMYITGYVLKESVKYGAMGYAKANAK